MPNYSSGLDVAFRALSDPTRRAVIARLARGPASTTALATPFPMALPSFMQHLAALEVVGLVTSRKVGRLRTWTLAPERLREAEDWLAGQRST